MPFDFAGKAIAISGAASGIGFATASYLYSAGALLSLTDVRKDALEVAIRHLLADSGSNRTSDLNGQEIGNGACTTVVHEDERVIAVAADVASSNQVDEWISRTLTKFGKLDGAANMAGVSSRAAGIHPITEVSDEDWQFLIDVNLTSVFYCMRAELRAMEACGTDMGSIVNASSIYGVEGKACSADYSAAKHGVVGLTRSVAQEFGGKRIRVNCVAP
jgi:NAD(P)-dependent dehydrogenase (short-subunit alcohol dehydrogenase family)